MMVMGIKLTLVLAGDVTRAVYVRPNHISAVREAHDEPFSDMAKAAVYLSGGQVLVVTETPDAIDILIQDD